MKLLLLILLVCKVFCQNDLHSKLQLIVQKLSGNAVLAKSLSSNRNPLEILLAIEDSNITQNGPSADKSDVANVLATMFLGMLENHEQFEPLFGQEYSEVTPSSTIARSFIDAIEKADGFVRTAHYRTAKAELLRSIKNLPIGCGLARLESIESQFRVLLSMLYNVEIERSSVWPNVHTNLMEIVHKHVGNCLSESEEDTLKNLTSSYEKRVISVNGCLPCLDGFNVTIDGCVKNNLILDILNENFVEKLHASGLKLTLLAQAQACKSAFDIERCLLLVFKSIEQRLEAMNITLTNTETKLESACSNQSSTSLPSSTTTTTTATSTTVTATIEEPELFECPKRNCAVIARLCDGKPCRQKEAFFIVNSSKRTCTAVCDSAKGYYRKGVNAAGETIYINDNVRWGQDYWKYKTNYAYICDISENWRFVDERSGMDVADVVFECVSNSTGLISNIVDYVKL